MTELEKSKPFKVTVNDTHYFVAPEETDALDVVKNGELYHIIKDNKNFVVEIEESDAYNKKFTLCINGNIHKIKIADKYDALIDKLGLKNVSKVLDANIKAPMPGLVLDVLVSVGQTVKAGEKIVILEAMKMENVITALSDGVVEAINIARGAAVEKGALLIEIKTAD